MNRKTFLRLSSSSIAGMMLAPDQALTQDKKIKNWAENLTYSTDKLFAAETGEDVVKFAQSNTKFKVLGSRHCFNNIADSKDQLLSLLKLNKIYSLDEDKRTVTVGSGIKYGELAPYLHNNGYALHNLASLPHISVAGACATATHGSGNGNLSTQVTEMELVKANGEVVTLSPHKDGEIFYATVVHLGALGIVSKLTLDVQPTFSVKQYVYQDLPLKELVQHFDAIQASGYSVSLFTDWQTNTINEVWVKQKVTNGATADAPKELFGAKAATRNVHPIIELSAENCTEQMGVPGPWYERLPHFKMGFTPSSGKELQSEYFIPRENAVKAIMAIQRMGKKIGPHLFISEIRTIDGDDLWMSPCYQQPSVSIHFTWKQHTPQVMALLPAIEKELAVFHAKPHWGKIFTISPARLNQLYKKMNDFRKLAIEFDPEGKFRNAFLNRNVFGG
ncbi:MAG: D-arabinono-1,4-lactone oxidase [Agriterribacter sp.]